MKISWKEQIDSAGEHAKAKEFSEHKNEKGHLDAKGRKETESPCYFCAFSHLNSC